MKLAQTLAGSWVITVPNPEERHWETELASFETGDLALGTPAHTALEGAAAAALAELARAFPHFKVSIVSHDPEAVARMRAAYELRCAPAPAIAAA